MKVAVSASTSDLSSQIDPRFGRCPYFLFVDPETMQFEAVENPNIASSSGAGIQSAQFVANKGANVLLTGSCGPNAFQTLNAAGVEVIVGVTGTVQEAIQQYKSGKLRLQLSLMSLPISAWEWVDAPPWDQVPEWEAVWEEDWAEEWAEVWIREWDMIPLFKLQECPLQARACLSYLLKRSFST